ncbi:hypothetical protein Tco_1059783 [Tanacetum coccineum]
MDVPTAGLWPPNLRKLYIGPLKMPISEWGPQKFPTTLVGLVLDGETDAATNWSQLSHLHLPSSLVQLGIVEFENLETKDAVEEAPTGPKSPISPVSE